MQKKELPDDEGMVRAMARCDAINFRSRQSQPEPVKTGKEGKPDPRPKMSRRNFRTQQW